MPPTPSGRPATSHPSPPTWWVVLFATLSGFCCVVAAVGYLYDKAEWIYWLLAAVGAAAIAQGHNLVDVVRRIGRSL